MDGVLDEVKKEARKLYDSYVDTGLKMNPPVKGFGIEFLWFAMDEPELFKLLMERDSGSADFREFVDGFAGKERILDAIEQSFGLKGENAETLYYQLLYLGIGLASIITSGSCRPSIGQASEILGKACRACLMEIKAGADERERYVPSEGAGPEGKVSSYVDKGMKIIQKQTNQLMLNTLVSQNYLLARLHDNPRYVSDQEWDQLERLMEQAFEMSSAKLKKNCPALTKGDIRLIILARFRFSVADQALLLGISPTSVTKARQRLKGKLGTGSIEQYIETL